MLGCIVDARPLWEMHLSEELREVPAVGVVFCHALLRALHDQPEATDVCVCALALVECVCL